jgi:hypothetical protein
MVRELILAAPGTAAMGSKAAVPGMLGIPERTLGRTG